MTEFILDKGFALPIMRRGIACIYFLPVEEATRPTDGEVLHNRWWICHPEYGLAMWATRARPGSYSPQCNKDIHVVSSALERIWMGVGAHVAFVPLVFDLRIELWHKQLFSEGAFSAEAFSEAERPEGP